MKKEQTKVVIIKRVEWLFVKNSGSIYRDFNIDVIEQDMQKTPYTKKELAERLIKEDRLLFIEKINKETLYTFDLSSVCVLTTIAIDGHCLKTSTYSIVKNRDTKQWVLSKPKK